MKPVQICHKVFRSGLFGSGVQLTDIFPNDNVEALASELLLAYHVALCREGRLNCFKRVTFEKHPINGITVLTTQTIRLGETKVGDQKRK